MKKYKVSLDTLVSFQKIVEVVAKDQEHLNEILSDLVADKLGPEDYDEIDIANFDFDIIDEKEVE